MNTRLPLLLSCVFLISAACTTGVIPIQFPTAQTITPDPFSTPIPTPFRPATYTPTNPLQEARTGTPIFTTTAAGNVTSAFEAPAPVEKTLYHLDVALALHLRGVEPYVSYAPHRLGLLLRPHDAHEVRDARLVDLPHHAYDGGHRRLDDLVNIL